MTATLIQPPQEKQSPLADHVLLKNISWQTYQLLLEDLAEQPGIRLIYDQGLLEIMTPLDPHEGNKKLLGRLVETLTEELNIEVRSLGSRTCQRQDLNRGFEPDQCYYIQNEPSVWDKEQIDLQQDPPPDLIIEIDITSSSINQLELYIAFRVPEVWRYDGKNITFYQLEGEAYRKTDNSPTFPFLSQSDIMHFLELKKTTRENAWIGLFREWVKSQIPTAN